jgi:hypothetical protein
VEHPIWLTHHREHHHDRCATVAGHLVCRRCLALYPLLFVVAVVVAGLGPGRLASIIAWVAPIPATIEYLAVGARVLAYRPRRVVAVTVLAALGFGCAVAFHFVTPFESRFLGPAGVHAGLWLVGALLGAWRSGPTSDPLADLSPPR